MTQAVADPEIDRATIESARWRGPIIVAVKVNFLIQYFVPVSRKSFLHSPDPLRSFEEVLTLALQGAQTVASPFSIGV